MPTPLLKFLLFFLRKQPLFVSILIFCTFAWSLDNIGLGYLLKILIDKLVDFNPETTQLYHYLIPTLVLYFITWLCADILFRLQGFVLAILFPKFEADIRMSMFDYIQHHSYNFFANNFSGSLSNKINDMVQNASLIVDNIFALFIPVFLAIIISISIFFTINHFFAIILLVYIILMTLIAILGAKRAAYLSMDCAASRNLLTGKIVDVFTNIINVKIFTRQRNEYNYIKKYQQIEQEKHLKAHLIIEKVRIILCIVGFLIPGILMTILIIYSYQHHLITIGEVVFIFNTTGQIGFMIWLVAEQFPNTFSSVGIARQALTIIAQKHEIVDKSEAKDFTISKGKIEFRDVGFHYYRDNLVFKKLSLKIEPKSKVGLVGFSGSGKTTFVNLLMRFFELASGEILIDGMEIRKMKIASLRSQISMIPQDPSLFHRTIRENIGYGKSNASFREILDASIKSHCYEFIKVFPQGYETLVGERGVKLSGGECQRIAIARAILENSPILILDEATAAFDSLTESYIQKSLAHLMQERTTIVVAHRLSTLTKMDRILVFDGGRIVEDGSHHELLNRDSLYKKMYSMQVNGFLLDKRG